MHAYLNADSAKGGEWLCAWRGGGRGISFNASALLSDSKLTRLYCAFLFFLSSPVFLSRVTFSAFPSSCQTYLLIPLRRIILVTQSHIPLLTVAAQYLGFWLVILHHTVAPAFTHRFSSLRQGSAAD